MTLSEVKKKLSTLDKIAFQLPDGNLVPSHFHVTEVGKVSKNFIDCGGTQRKEEVVNFQLWNAEDYDHRLHPEKLMSIIELSEKALAIGDLEVEVEYQAEIEDSQTPLKNLKTGLQTIGKFGLDFDGQNFLLTTKQTDCLAKEKCGIPEEVTQQKSENNCDPESGCC